jgi:PPP family 3-phenylpropionic acid transporter
MTQQNFNNLKSIRIFFFVFIGSTAFLYPYLSLFLSRKGLNGLQIGVVMTINAIVAMFAAPLWINLSKKFSRQQLAIQISLFFSSIGIIFLCKINTFLGLIFAIGLHSLLRSGLEPLSDSLAMVILKQETKAGFGSVRLWGSMGWAILVVLSGWIIQNSSTIISFMICAVLQIIAAIILFRIVLSVPKAEHQKSKKSPVFESKSIKVILSNGPLLYLIAALTCYWSMKTGLWNLEAVYLDQLGANESFIGIANMINAAVEIPFLLYADRLREKIGSIGLLLGAFIASGINMLMVIIVPTVTMVVLGHILQGVSFGFFSVGLIEFINENTSSTESASVYALITVTLKSCVSIIFSPIDGLIFDVYGGYGLFILGLVSSLFACIILIILNRKRNIMLTSKAHGGYNG